MTSKERVKTTLNHQIADQLPVDYMFEDYRTLNNLAAHFGMSNEAFLDYLGCDIVFFNVMDEIQKFIYDPFLMDYTFKNGFARKDEKDPGIAYDRWGIGWRMDHDGERPVSRVLKEASEIPSYRVPDPIKDGQFFDIENNIKKFNDKGYAVAVGQYYGLFEKAWLIRGYEDFLYDCYDNRDLIEILLDKILDYRIEISKKIVTYDIAFGHSGDDYGTQRGPIMSLELWRTLFKPRLAKIWEIYKKAGFAVVHHSCGDCSIYLDDMIEIGLDAIHPVQSASMDIEELGKRFGNNLVFYGGIDCQQVLDKGTPDDVRKNVEYVVRNLAKHSNMILAPINVMRNVPIVNFEALVESINKFKKIG